MTLSGALRAATAAGLAVALAAPLAAWLTDWAWGREVLLIAPHDPSVVELNRALWNAGDPVAELYGNPLSAPVRALVVDPTALIVPGEAPELTLLPSTPEGRAFQTQTLWLGVRLLAFGALATAAAAGLAAGAITRRQRARIEAAMVAGAVVAVTTRSAR